jgi:putative transposase
VSSSGYYAWRGRASAKRHRQVIALYQRVEAIRQHSRGTYGAPRICQELKAEGQAVGRKRVARLMRLTGLGGVSRRKSPTTTRRDPRQRPAPDLVQRPFQAEEANRLWVAEITYVPTRAGFLYLAVVPDVWSRKVVGWSTQTRLRSEMVLAALEMAVARRGPSGEVIHHSDQGSQYTSIAFGKRCRAAGVRPSMGSVGDCYDNAMCESVFATLECELPNRQTFRTIEEARRGIFEYIEGRYNSQRRHSGIEYRSPMEYESLHQQSA